MYGDADPACAASMLGRAKTLNPPTDTELSSLLNTLSQQAHEIRSLIGNVLTRVCPQPEECGADCPEFGSGYVGMAEQIRSVQRETINLLIALGKVA